METNIEWVRTFGSKIYKIFIKITDSDNLTKEQLDKLIKKNKIKWINILNS